MVIYQPYTYLIVHKTTGRRYYGVRTAFGCSPSDLWTKYFTSSKIVRGIIEREGKDAFTFEVRRLFMDKNSAFAWEHKVLRRMKVKDDPMWLNLSDGKSHSFFSNRIGRRLSSKTRAKMTGRKVTQETRKKMSSAQSGKIVSDETKAKQSATRNCPNFKTTQISRQSKLWQITLPDGSVQVITNLNQYCKDNQLDQGHMTMVANGKRRHHKSYGCERLNING